MIELRLNFLCPSLITMNNDLAPQYAKRRCCWCCVYQKRWTEREMKCTWNFDIDSAKCRTEEFWSRTAYGFSRSV
jgi:hypothetical protein